MAIKETLGEIVNGDEEDLIREEIAEAMNPPSDEEDIFLQNSSCDILGNFRTIALKSYKKERFLEDIPELMWPLINRSDTLIKGYERVYHKLRKEYIIKIVKELIEENPVSLRNFERKLLSFFIYHVTGRGNSNQSQEEFSDAVLKFRIFELNLGDIYYLFSRKRCGEGGYILGIADNGKIYRKSMRKPKRISNKEDLNNEKLLNEYFGSLISPYRRIHAHASTFFCMDPEVVSKIVPDNLLWAFDKSRLNEFSDENEKAGAIGIDMLESGIRNKHFYSSHPYEVIINSKNIKKMRVIDVPPKGIYFSTEFNDGSISIGILSAKNEEGKIACHTSDHHAKLILGNSTTKLDTLGLVDIAGCIARDMFVCEEKNKFYSETRVKGTGSKKKSQKTERVIWLPRFKINLIGGKDTYENISAKVSSLAPHHVSGHKHRLPRGYNPDPNKLDLAKELGVQIPEGYTYVREYDHPGSGEFERQYKSRSALELLFRE